MDPSPLPVAPKRRRTVLVSAALTASASVIAATLIGAQGEAEADDRAAPAAQYGDPVAEDD